MCDYALIATICKRPTCCRLLPFKHHLVYPMHLDANYADIYTIILQCGDLIKCETLPRFH